MVNPQTSPSTASTIVSHSSMRGLVWRRAKFSAVKPPKIVRAFRVVPHGTQKGLRPVPLRWLCFPRFNSIACFAALLGSPDNGHWSIAPKAAHPKVSRRYCEGTLLLESEFCMPKGTVVLIDCMDRRELCSFQGDSVGSLRSRGLYRARVWSRWTAQPFGQATQ